MKNIINANGDKLTNWNGGFYSNKNDSRFMVPKSKPGIGWTLNFGNPKAVKSFIVLIFIVIGIVLFFNLVIGLK